MSTLQGLSSTEIATLLGKYGENVLPSKEKKSNLSHLLNQFSSPLIYILVIAGVITFLLGEYPDSFVIFLAVIVNTAMGFYQELKAGQALDALQSMLDPAAKVIRDSEAQKISISKLVPGDVVLLAQGDRIPADGILIESVNYSADESILTGESLQVVKQVNSEVFMGTISLTGRAVMEIRKTGEETRMGSIASNLISVKETKTPLQHKLDHLAKILAISVLALSVAIFAIGIILGESFVEMFTTSVAIAVAAIPEGMAISLTVILALGMQKILKRKALVRKLVAAETLGSVTVIATDKTGTLTEGKMRVAKIDIIDKEKAVMSAILANNVTGPLEIALWEWAYDIGYDPQRLTDTSQREAETPFSSEHKYMSVTVNGRKYYKGAPEVLLRMSSQSSQENDLILQKVKEWSQGDLRVIALAQSNIEGGEFEWVGLLGLVDPVRENLAEVFSQTKSAGIRTIILTGDYAGTAESVWRKVKLSTSEPHVVDGTELDSLSQEDLKLKVKSVDIFARVKPEHKLKIVEALQANGEVVALVGDGVNDAPALKKANIGIVVAEASDVSKETADMVLLDSNFQTIVAAIEEGRGMFQNLKKVVLYLMSDSFTQIFLVMGTLIAQLPLPMTAAQILWINVMTDGLPATALSTEKHDHGLLQKSPNSISQSIIDRNMRNFIVIISTITAAVGFAMFTFFLSRTDLYTARTMTFSILGMSTLLYVFSVRTLNKPLWSVNLLSNPFLLVAAIVAFIFQYLAVSFWPLQNILKTHDLNFNQWLIVFFCAIGVTIFIEISKRVFHNRKIL